MKRELPGLELLRGVVPVVGLYGLSYMREIVVASTRDGDTGFERTDVRLVLESEGSRPNGRATFEFEGVGGLKLDCASHRVRLGLLSIEDMHDRQWDGVAWRVGDLEQSGLLEIYSRAARLVSVEVLAPDAPTS